MERQGPTPSPILFNTFINDIFIFIDTAFLGNHADDTTHFIQHKTILKQPSNSTLKFYNFTKMVLGKLNGYKSK